MVLDPFRDETPDLTRQRGRGRLADAKGKADQVFGSADLINTDPTQAETLLHDAWAALGRAETSGVRQPGIRSTSERLRVAAGLDDALRDGASRADRRCTRRNRHAR